MARVMPLAFSVETSYDGKATSHIVLDAASLNSGVLSKLFEIPEALLEQEALPASRRN